MNRKIKEELILFAATENRGERNAEKTEEKSREIDGERERWRELGSAGKNEIARGKFRGRSRERER